jgi:urease accessory protein
MEAAARIVASAGDRLEVLYGEPPLLPRRTGPNEVHFVGGAAGPLGGDRLRIDVCVRAGASLVVRSVAATIAYPSRDGAPSQLDVHATVGAGGRLEWRPEPLIAVRRCNHRTTSTVDLAADASLVWRDELVCGRHGEGPGDVCVLTSVHVEKRPLYAHELAVGPAAVGWSGAAVLGGARVHASTLYVGVAVPAGPGTAMELAGGGTVITEVR